MRHSREKGDSLPPSACAGEPRRRGPRFTILAESPKCNPVHGQGRDRPGGGPGNPPEQERAHDAGGADALAAKRKPSDPPPAFCLNCGDPTHFRSNSDPARVSCGYCAGCFRAHVREVDRKHGERRPHRAKYEDKVRKPGRDNRDTINRRRQDWGVERVTCGGGYRVIRRSPRDGS